MNKPPRRPRTKSHTHTLRNSRDSWIVSAFNRVKRFCKPGIIIADFRRPVDRRFGSRIVPGSQRKSEPKNNAAENRGRIYLFSTGILILILLKIALRESLVPTPFPFISAPGTLFPSTIMFTYWSSDGLGTLSGRGWSPSVVAVRACRMSGFRGGIGGKLMSSWER